MRFEDKINIATNFVREIHTKWLKFKLIPVLQWRQSFEGIYCVILPRGYVLTDNVNHTQRVDDRLHYFFGNSC